MTLHMKTAITDYQWSFKFNLKILAVKHKNIKVKGEIIPERVLSNDNIKSTKYRTNG